MRQQYAVAHNARSQHLRRVQGIKGIEVKTGIGEGVKYDSRKLLSLHGGWVYDEGMGWRTEVHESSWTFD
jgi:hypothetical protein